MELRSLAAFLLACSFALPLAVTAEPVQVYRGTTHDALFGLCIDGQNGIAVGGSGLVLESSDGGQSWTEQSPFTPSALLDVSCGAGADLIVAQEGKIFRRDGDSFEPVDSGTEARLLAVAANSAGLAYAVGSFGTILQSTDGGVSWEPVVIDWEAILNDFVEPHLYDVDISEEGVVTIIGEFELVMRSTDGGNSWETANKGEPSLFGLSLTANGNGFAVGQDGRVVRTSDGGITWSEVIAPTGGILLNVWSSDSGEVLISGIRSLLVSNDDGATWTPIQGGDLNTGWYQGLEITSGGDASGITALLAGHQGSVIELQVN